MKRNYKIYGVLLIIFLLLSGVTIAEDRHDSTHENHQDKKHDEDEDHHEKGHKSHEGHGASKSIGEGKAIIEVDEDKGLRLSEEAIKSLRIELILVGNRNFNIKKNALVRANDEKGIYRFRQGYFKFLPAKIIKENSENYLIEVKDIKSGDQVVVNGVSFLRVADVYSVDESEYGHGH